VKEAHFRGRLAAGDRLVGTAVSLPDVGLAELTASAVDFVWIDLEHGALSAGDVQPLAIAARSAGAASLVRLRSPEDDAVGPALDAGVDGVVAPRIDHAGQAEHALAMLRYPPRGSRGVAARRASAYGPGATGAADPVFMAQIESVAGVREAHAIARVDGVDALVVGCADLALDAGEDAAHPTEHLREAVADVQRAAAAAGIPSGVAGPADPVLLAALVAGRSSVLVLGADVRIYACALRDEFGRLDDEQSPAGREEAEEAHVGA
jgi:2-keto-3-deoxy-L-rhamnonate aldolase RhmA